MNYIVAVTGASGAIYAQSLLRALVYEGSHIQLIISEAARLVLKHELDLDLPRDMTEARLLLRERLLGDKNYPYLHLYDVNDMFASFSSGSAVVDGMIVAPCSMGTLARIAQGVSSNLIERAADVTLKERRPLVLAPRETPLNAVHLRNMLELSRAGAHIAPCMPAFYHRPRKIEDLTDFMTGKILDLLGVGHSLFERWSGE